MNAQIPDAEATVTVAAERGDVWKALTDPAIIRKYFLGTNVETTWKVGDPITYSGEYNGNSYEDKGTVLEFEPMERVKTTHFSPSTGLPDAPENYHTVEYRLADEGQGTSVTIVQGNNKSLEEVQQSTDTWGMVLQDLQELLEAGKPGP
ncbi:SRPBCC domain-containing protein [Paenarthrobacter sp. NPDC018779]|uniref:SRPBCC domain-containing protein n=1 Tax=Paenarthrobacter sp. NPDC018779 TaxID=3364375 RepID=UPI0037C93773